MVPQEALTHCRQDHGSGLAPWELSNTLDHDTPVDHDRTYTYVQLSCNRTSSAYSEPEGCGQFLHLGHHREPVDLAGPSGRADREGEVHTDAVQNRLRGAA